MKYIFSESPFTIWLTGLSGSGKTTIANQLHKFFINNGSAAYVIDGDILREGLCADLSFSLEHRSENIRRAAEVSSMLNSAGVIAIVALISPLIVDRKKACNIITAKAFAEIYISTSLEVCEQRDVKGLYGKARRNEICDFTGISSPYEPPKNPLLEIDTSALSTHEAVDIIISALARKFNGV
jgi:adenylyl-sulfate kinase